MPEVSWPATSWSSISEAVAAMVFLSWGALECVGSPSDWVSCRYTTGWVADEFSLSFSEWMKASAASHMEKHHLSISPPARSWGCRVLKV